MRVDLYKYIEHTRRETAPVVRRLADISDTFARAFATMSSQLTLEPADQERFFMKVAKTRSPLPTHIQLPPYPDDVPVQDQIGGIVQMLELYYLFARGTLRRYYVFTTPSMDQLRRGIVALDKTLRIPLHELKVFRRSRSEPPESILKKDRETLPPDIEMRHVKGAHYTHTFYELYVLNSAYSLALAYVLVGIHFGTIWFFGEHWPVTRAR